MSIINPYRFQSGLFLPSDIAGLQVWFDASDSSTLFDATSGGSIPAGDGAVLRWEDKCGNANHATQGTATKEPIRKTSAINGLDAIYFDGSNDNLNLASEITSSDCSLFVVIERATTSVESYGLGGDALRYGLRWASNNIFYLYFNGNGGAGSSSTATGTFCLTGLLDGLNTPESNPDFGYLDGSQVFPSSGVNRSLLSPTSFKYIGMSGNARWVKGNMCEILCYDNYLSNDNINTIHSYLADKWGITIATL